MYPVARLTGDGICEVKIIPKSLKYSLSGIFFTKEIFYNRDPVNLIFTYT